MRGKLGKGADLHGSIALGGKAESVNPASVWLSIEPAFTGRPSRSLVLEAFNDPHYARQPGADLRAIRIDAFSSGAWGFRVSMTDAM